MTSTAGRLVASGAAGGPTAAVAMQHGWAGVAVTVAVTLGAALLAGHGKDLVAGLFGWLTPPHLRLLRWLLRKDHVAGPLTPSQLIALTTALHGHEADVEPQAPAAGSSPGQGTAAERPRRGTGSQRRNRREGRPIQ